MQTRSLYALLHRWRADLARLERAYPVETWEADMPEVEVIRNLATAIAQMEMLTARASVSGAE